MHGGLGKEWKRHMKEYRKYVEEMLELYEEKRCITITVMKGRTSLWPQLHINNGDEVEKQIPISEIGSPKVYDIDDAGVLYQSQTSGHEADICAPVVSVHTRTPMDNISSLRRVAMLKRGGT